MDNLKGMDEQLIFLKVFYNDLGVQVIEGKQDLERVLQLVWKMKKEVVFFFEWFFVIEVELVQKFILEGLFGDLDIEIFWVKNVLKDLEKRKVDLNIIIESSVVL